MKKQFTILLLLATIGFSQNKTTVLLPKNAEVNQKLEKNASEFITAINLAYSENKQPDITKGTYTSDALESLNNLWKSRPFYCPETKIITNVINRADNNLEIRNFPLLMKNDAGESVEEEGVLVFNRNGQVADIKFTVSKQQYNSIIRSGANVTDLRRRQIILDFVESFRTAYNRKDLPYIEKVFSDDALIIIGKVLKSKGSSLQMMNDNLGAAKVKLIRQNKTQYISGLKKLFNTSKFIKVGYDNIEISQHPNQKEVYGVTLKQYWASSGYSDVGYLFLMIDFQDEQNPIIHVRSWQPQEFTKESERIQLGDFELVR